MTEQELLAQDVYALKEQIRLSKTALECIEMDIKQRKEELKDIIKRTTTEPKSKLDELNYQIDGAKRALNTIEYAVLMANSELQKKNQQIRTANDLHKENRVKKQSEVNDIEQNIKFATSRVDSLTQQGNTIEQNNDLLRQKQSSIEQEIMHIEKQKAEKREELNVLAQDVILKKGEIEALESSKTAIAQKEKELDEWEHRLRLLERDLRIMANRLKPDYIAAFKKFEPYGI